jgi:hypothetical protein
MDKMSGVDYAFSCVNSSGGLEKLALLLLFATIQVRELWVILAHQAVPCMERLLRPLR